jgi:1,4-alpha-glucan branching enzyme
MDSDENLRPALFIHRRVQVSKISMNRLLPAFALLFLVIGCATTHRETELLDHGVRFAFTSPVAVSVTIAGSFNRWDAEKDRLIGPDAGGVWTITLPLSAGRYEYRYLVNGKDWFLDPAVPAEDDGLEGRNSVVIVPNRAEAR